jgi:hypothetical protein
MKQQRFQNLWARDKFESEWFVPTEALCRFKRCRRLCLDWRNTYCGGCEFLCESIINAYLGTCCRVFSDSKRKYLLLDAYHSIKHKNERVTPEWTKRAIKRRLKDEKMKKLVGFRLIIIPVCRARHWVFMTIERKWAANSTVLELHTTLYNSHANEKQDPKFAEQYHRIEQSILHFVTQEVAQEAAGVKVVLLDRVDGEIPQQNNGYDCGIFICQAVKHKLAGHPMGFSQQDIPTLRTSMEQELTRALEVSAEDIPALKKIFALETQVVLFFFFFFVFSFLVSSSFYIYVLFLIYTLLLLLLLLLLYSLEFQRQMQKV